MSTTLKALVENSNDSLTGLEATFVGYQDQGMVIEYINPANLDIDFLAAYTSELIRANAKFKSVLSKQSEIKYIITSTSQNRLILQMIPNTEFYVAMVTNNSVKFEDSIPVFKKLLMSSRKILVKKSVAGLRA